MLKASSCHRAGQNRDVCALVEISPSFPVLCHQPAWGQGDIWCLLHQDLPDPFTLHSALLKHNRQHNAIHHLHLVGLNFKASHRLPNSCCYFSEFSAYVGLNCTATCAKPSQSLLLCPYCKTRTLRPAFSCMALSILTCSSQARCQWAARTSKTEEEIYLPGWSMTHGCTGDIHTVAHGEGRTKEQKSQQKLQTSWPQLNSTY